MKKVIYIFLITLMFSIGIYSIKGWAATDEIKDVLIKGAEAVAKYKGKNLSEANTKTIIIEPILKSLGWRVLEPDDVDREYSLSPKKVVDYALKIKRPLVFLEVIPLDKNLYDRVFIDRIISFADEVDVKWVIITNGNEYRLYKSDEIGDIDQKIVDVFTIEDISKGDKYLDDVVGKFAYLTKNSIERHELDKRAEIIFKERKLNSVLNELVDMITKQLKGEKELKLADIKRAKGALINLISERLIRLEKELEKREKEIPPPEKKAEEKVTVVIEEPILEGTVEDGDRIFHEICFACHGERGEGDAFGRQFGTEPGRTVGPTLCGGALHNVSNSKLRKIITYGRPTSLAHGVDMPNWGETLTQKEISSVILYLRKCNEVPLVKGQ